MEKTKNDKYAYQEGMCHLDKFFFCEVMHLLVTAAAAAAAAFPVMFVLLSTPEPTI